MGLFNGVTGLASAGVAMAGLLGVGFGVGSWVQYPTHERLEEVLVQQGEVLGELKNLAKSNSVTLEKIETHMADTNVTRAAIRSNIAANEAAIERMDTHLVEATKHLIASTAKTEAQTEVLKNLIEILMKQRGDG